MVCLGLEPGAAGWKAQTNPLSYGGTPFEGILFLWLGHLKMSFYCPTSQRGARRQYTYCTLIYSILLLFCFTLVIHLSTILSFGAYALFLSSYLSVSASSSKRVHRGTQVATIRHLSSKFVFLFSLLTLMCTLLPTYLHTSSACST